MGERCRRCCLNKSMRVVNLILNLCGIGMIVYSLWLQKMWDDGVSRLSAIVTSSLPRPWYGNCSLLSDIAGIYGGSLYQPTYSCYQYIFALCALLFLQLGVIVAIFFKIDWGSEIAKCIDDHHKKFESFVIFHVEMCRLIVMMAVLAQISVVVVAVILWAIGTAPRKSRQRLQQTYQHDFTQSFLVIPNPAPLPEYFIGSCRVCEELDQMTQYESFLSFIEGVFRIRLYQRRIISDHVML